MKSIEGIVIVAYWIIGSSVLAITRLLAQVPDIVAHPAGWRAAVGPFVVAVVGVLGAVRLLNDHRAIQLPAVLLAVQLLALSVGPLAFRLDVGPFLRVAIGGLGVTTDFGNDARLLLILGSGNRVPPGAAVNLLSLTALLLLVAAHRASHSAHAG